MSRLDQGHVVSCSIIVTTRNSAATIHRVLKSALQQTIASEVVVVDNFSTDVTAEIARSLGAKVFQVAGERSFQRNAGAKLATGDWLLFVDADMVLSPDVVQSSFTECSKTGADAAVIPQSAEGYGFLAKARAFEKACYVGDDFLEAPRFFSRDLFEQIGGYDPNLVAAEDWDIAARVHAQAAVVTRSQGQLIHLDGRIRLSEVFRKMQYYSPSLLAYRAKHPDLAARQMSPFRGAWWRHWVSLSRRPLLFAGIVLLKSTEVIGFLVGAVKAKTRDRRMAVIGR
jgi:glycosyltransferase involved in cell wall biosynthesis